MTAMFFSVLGISENQTHYQDCRRNGVDQDVFQLWPCQRAVVEKVGKKMKTAQQRIHSAKEDIDQYVISKVQFILKSTLKDVYERTGVFPKQCLKELP